MYSSSTLTVNVLAGTASLRVDPPIIDFGLIEVATSANGAGATAVTAAGSGGKTAIASSVAAGGATTGGVGLSSSISAAGALRTLTLTNDGTLALAYHIKPSRSIDQLPFKLYVIHSW